MARSSCCWRRQALARASTVIEQRRIDPAHHPPIPTIIAWKHGQRNAADDAWRRGQSMLGYRDVSWRFRLNTFEWIIALLLGAVLLSAAARRAKVPYPTFLALGGVLLAFLPSGPAWTLEPDLALALFVAPVLLDAAYDTSLRELRDNWLPVSMLVLVAVGVTTTAVAVLAHW